MGETQSSESLGSSVDGSQGIICSLCCENLTKKDEAFVITCGHLFHSQCIQVWRLLYKNCPKCRKSTPKLMKVLPIFTQNPNEETILDTSEEMIKILETEIKELNEQLIESEKNCNLLKDKNDVLENEIRELKNHLSPSIKRENQIKMKGLDEKLSERENNYKQLKDKNEVLGYEIHELNDYLLDSINEESSEKPIELGHTQNHLSPSIKRENQIKMKGLDEKLSERENNYKQLKDKNEVLENEIHELNDYLLDSINEESSEKPIELGYTQNAGQLKIQIDSLLELEAASDEKNKILSDKLNCVSTELKQQLLKCSDLSLENRKLQGLIETNTKFVEDTGTPIKAMSTFNEHGEENVNKQADKHIIEKTHDSSLYMYAKQKLKPHRYWMFFDGQNDQIMVIKAQNSKPTILRNKEEVNKFIEQPSENGNNLILNIRFEN